MAFFVVKMSFILMIIQESSFCLFVKIFMRRFEVGLYVFLFDKMLVGKKLVYKYSNAKKTLNCHVFNILFQALANLNVL